MASLFQGQPLTAPSYAATTSDVPKWLQDYTVDLFSQQRAVAARPYEQYQLPRIAAESDDTRRSQDLIQRNVGVYQPVFQNAIAGTQKLAGAKSVDNISAYMNPYIQNVTDQIAKLGARNLSENLLPQVSDQFVRAGQFGSSGMGTFGNRALRDTQEAILANQSQALNTGYGQAMNASAADMTRQQGALAQAGDLAKSRQGLTTADAAALETIGAQQEARQQKGLDVAYQDFKEEVAHPQKQIDVTSATLRGLPPAAIPTTSTTSGYTTQFAPSLASQAVGAYSTYKGLTSAKGGLISGYAEGGAVGADDLESSVMADYGQYFQKNNAPAYAIGGSVTDNKYITGKIPTYTLPSTINVGKFPFVGQQYGFNTYNTNNPFPNRGNMGFVGTGFLRNVMKALGSNTADHYAKTMAQNNAGSTDLPSFAPKNTPRDLEALMARYYAKPQAAMSHGGRVPGYAQEGYVDVEDPAPEVDGGQAFADQYAAMQQEYPTQQDAPVMVAPTMSYMQDPEVMQANAERKELLKQLQKSLSTTPAGRDSGPTESEMWFNRAAAFLDPGKTGSFGEGVQHLATAEAGHQAEKRKARIANQAADLQRLQARSELAQKQYEMTMDEGKRRMIEQYLSPTPRSTEGAAVSGYNTGVPDNMRALLLSQEPADAVKTLVEMAKESNKPSDLIKGVRELVKLGKVTEDEGAQILQEQLQGKLEMLDVVIPELSGTHKLTGPEARKYYDSGALPKRLTPTAAPTAAPAEATIQAAPAQDTSRQLPLSQEQMEAKKTGLIEQSKKDIEASDSLLSQKSFAKQQKDAANLVLGYAKTSPKSFGILADPNWKNAAASLLESGVSTPWGNVGLAVEEPIAKLKLTGPEASVRQLAAAPIAMIEVGYRKMFLKGEGSVSNMEGALTKYIGPQLSDNARTVQLKAGMITIGAEKQEKVVDAFEKYKEQRPEAGPRSFYQTPEYKRIVEAYDTKYRNFAEKNGIPVASSTTVGGGSLADRFRQERANAKNKEGK
jgi:hypothetical protein